MTAEWNRLAHRGEFPLHPPFTRRASSQSGMDDFKSSLGGTFLDDSCRNSNPTRCRASYFRLKMTSL